MPQHTRSALVTLLVGSDTVELAGYARHLLEKLWRPGMLYKKVGVMPDGFERAEEQQFTQFGAAVDAGKRTELIATLDAPSRRYGKGAVQVAAAILRR